MSDCYKKIQKVLLRGVVLFGVLASTGCSLLDMSGKKVSSNSNVAYAVPDKVATDGVDTRRKPTRPLWTEDKVDSLDFDRVSQSKVYIVRKGDTLYGIARKFGISVRKLMELNNLNNDSRLFVGQEVRLPVKKTPKRDLGEDFGTRNTISYTVKHGDSLYKIAKKYAMTIKEIKEVNRLASDRIYDGQVIKVYGDVDARRSMIEHQVVENPSKAHRSQHAFVLDPDGYYTIQPGDTLGKIAHEFHVSAKQLRMENGIDDPTRLQVGKKLVIPNHKANLGEMGDTRARFLTPETMKDTSFFENVRTSEMAKGRTSVQQSTAGEVQPVSDDFFENFDEIPVVEINN